MAFTQSITSLANYTLTGTRRAEAALVAGREQPTVNTTFTAPNCSVQPPTNEDLQRLPEGRTVDDALVVFSTTRLQVGGPDTGYQPDLLTIRGQLYEVEHLEHWPAFGVEYWYAIVRRMQ